MDTDPIPTHSGILGLLAASLGCPIGVQPEWFSELAISLRADERGEIFDAIQVITSRLGPGVVVKDEMALRYKAVYDLGFDRKKAETSGKKPSQILAKDKDIRIMAPVGNGNALVHRTYIGGATFLVEVKAPGHEQELLEALKDPRFSPYLGRKAFAPTFPFVLGAGEEGLLKTLPTVSHNPKLAVHELKKFTRSHQPDGFVAVERLGFDQWLDEVSSKLAL